MAATHGVVDGGVRVVGVNPGCPAEAAGLKAGDFVLSCGGVKTPSARALQAAVEGARVGEALELRVRRAGSGEATTLLVTPEDVPEEVEACTTSRATRGGGDAQSDIPAPARYGTPPMPGAGGGFRGL